MRVNGYYGIGIEHAKTEFNYWTLFRTAQIFDANFLFIINKRFKKNCADTMCSYRHMPVFSYNDFDDFNAHRPYDCQLIGIELIESAQNLANFVHPKRAIYLLGAEDHGLTAKAISACNAIIKLPGEHSLNVSVAGSIVIYDRISKKFQGGFMKKSNKIKFIGSAILVFILFALAQLFAILLEPLITVKLSVFIIISWCWLGWGANSFNRWIDLKANNLKLLESTHKIEFFSIGNNSYTSCPYMREHVIVGGEQCINCFYFVSTEQNAVNCKYKKNNT